MRRFLLFLAFLLAYSNDLMCSSYVLFNDPLGTKEEQKVIINHIISLVKNTPSKESIAVGLYSFDDKEVAKALIDATKRGVVVELALDKYGEHYKDNRVKIDKGNYENRAIINMLRDKINRLTVCGDKKSNTIQSCISNRKNSIHHEKYFLFSLSYHPVTHKKMENIVLVTSSNMTTTAQLGQWNDAFISYGDKENWYQPWYKHFQDQLNQKRNSSYFNPKLYTGYIQSLNSGYEAYFSPSRKKDIVESILKKVKGNTLGECSLLVNQAYFSNYRTKVVNQFIRIKKMGCDVRVLVAKTKVFGKKIRKKLDNAGIEYNYMLKKKRYTHHKFILYKGDYAEKKAQNIVWLGSHNLTYNANRFNDEVIVKVAEKHIYTAYRQYFNHHWKNLKPMRTICQR